MFLIRDLLDFRVPVLKISFRMRKFITLFIVFLQCVIFENLSHSKVDMVINIIQTNFILFRCVWTMLPSYLSGMERCWTQSVTQALNRNQLLYYSSWYLKKKCWELLLCLLFPFVLVNISAWSNCIDEIALEVKFFYFYYFMQITCSCYVLHANFVNIFMDPQDFF